MTSLQVKGPLAGDPEDLVSFRKNYVRTQGQERSEFFVSIHLGEKTRDIDENDAAEAPVLPKTEADQPVAGGETTSLKQLEETQNTLEMPLPSEQIEETTLSESQNGDLGSLRPAPEESQVPDRKPDTLPLWPPNRQNAHAETQNKESATTESDSELEIVEVRVLSPRKPEVTQEDYDSDDSDLSSLDQELNHMLTSSESAPTQLDAASQFAARKRMPIHQIIPTLYKQVKARTSPPPPGYRNIPPNLVNTIQRELNFFYDNGGDDDLEVVGKVVFSLKDPYSATKIKLPVKATTCRHFECFDFDTFCVFHNIPHGVKYSLKKALVQKSNESRRNEQFFLKQQQQIANGTLLFKAPGLVYPLFSEHGQMFFSEIYSRTPPLYKCPLCDEKFALKQLYISDIFNFFVKTTPLHTTRIELVEADRYKILQDDAVETRDESVDLVVLSEDEQLSGEGEMGPRNETASKSFMEDFDDGLDDVLVKLSQGDGTWGNPMTLD